MNTFLAIDFETANSHHSSACAVAAVEVKAARIVRKLSFVLQCQAEDFTFSGLHGITRDCSAQGVSFADAWSEIEPVVRECDSRLAAHNAKFDRRVLESCARRSGIRLPRLRWTCTRNLAEAVWGLRPADLETVSRYLAIPLVHHDPLSDAEAAAQICIAAELQKLARLATKVQS
jgi:DNA polymerase III subunit epsilon